MACLRGIVHSLKVLVEPMSNALLPEAVGSAGVSYQLLVTVYMTIKEPDRIHLRHERGFDRVGTDCL